MILRPNTSCGKPQDKYHKMTQELRLLARHNVHLENGKYTLVECDNKTYLWHKKLNKPIAYLVTVGRRKVIKCRGGCKIVSEISRAWRCPVVVSTDRDLRDPVSSHTAHIISRGVAYGEPLDAPPVVDMPQTHNNTFSGNTLSIPQYTWISNTEPPTFSGGIGMIWDGEYD